MSQLINANVRNKLLALRSGLRRRLAAEAAGWLVLALVALVLVTLAFDYGLRLDRLQRGVIMLLCLGFVGFVGWRNLVRPLAAPMSLDDLALLVERRNLALGDRLISAIQLERGGQEDDQISRAMIRRMSDEANALAGVVEVHPIIERSRLRRVGLAALLAAALLGSFWAWQSDIMALWLARNVAFADTPWPQRTYLDVVGGPDFSILRGDDLTVEIDPSRSRTIPTFITVHARFPSVGWTEDRIELTVNGHGRFEKKFPAVREDFEFYVVGGDDRRDQQRPHQVRLKDAPALSELQFTVGYPAYMKEKPRVFDASSGALAVPMGSTISIDALCTKDLRPGKCRIVMDGADIAPLQVRSVQGQDGQSRPRGVSGSFEVRAPQAATLPSSQPVRRDPARALRLVLEDTDGYTNRHSGQYVLQVLPDQAPSVTLRKRAVGAMITPRAMIPLLIEAKDDCGVDVLRVMQTPAGRKAAPAPQELRKLGDDPRLVRLSHTVDLQPVPEREGQAPDPKLLPQPGTLLNITVQAEDTLPPVLGGPNRFTSTILEFKVVKPEELMAELVRRQKEVRLDFEQVIAQQASAQSKSADAAQLAASGVSPDCARLLTESSTLQTTVAAQVVKTAATLESVLDELVQNRLGTPDEITQLSDGIIKPLRGLGAPMAQAVAGLTGAARLTDAATLREQGTKVAAVQAGFLARLREVLERMAKLESRQEMAYKLEMILRTWDELIDVTRAKSDQQVRTIFDPTSKPATNPAGPEKPAPTTAPAPATAPAGTDRPVPASGPAPAPAAPK